MFTSRFNVVSVLRFLLMLLDLIYIFLRNTRARTVNDLANTFSSYLRSSSCLLCLAIVRLWFSQLTADASF